MRTRSATPRASAPPDRDFEAGHLDQVAGDGLGLAAFLGAQAGPGTRRVYEGEDGDAELLGQLHEAEGLAVALGVGHAEVAAEVLLGVAAALVADDHDGLAFETGPPAHDGRIVAEGAVAVGFNEVGEGEPQVVGGEGPFVAAGDLDALEGRQVFVDLGAELGQLLFEGGDLLGDLELLIARHLFELVDLFLELGDRSLELQCRGGAGHGVNSRVRGEPGHHRVSHVIPTEPRWTPRPRHCGSGIAPGCRCHRTIVSPAAPSRGGPRRPHGRRS
jgi:hypothetical protein